MKLLDGCETEGDVVASLLNTPTEWLVCLMQLVQDPHGPKPAVEPTQVICWLHVQPLSGGLGELRSRRDTHVVFYQEVIRVILLGYPR